ncbi:MAG: sulfotransferase family protein [Woeseiaceae bacterium]
MTAQIGARGGRPPIDEPVFLMGTTRSGTSLLSLMLGHHPEIAFVGELEWVWDFAPGAAAPALDRYYSWLATHRHYLAHRLHLDRALGFEDLVRSFLRQMRAAADPGATRPHVGCQLHRHYAQALAIWPGARCIHIVRDGRDVCASWIRFGWLGNAYEGGLRWREAIEEWTAVKSRIAPARRTELRFEDLLRSPERELSRLCAFLGVPYSDAMLRYHEDTTYGPVDPGQAGKWRIQLTNRDVRLFEAAAGESLVAHGYALSGERPYPLKPWSHRLLRIDDRLRHHRARARIYGPRLWLADILARRIGVQALRDRVRLALNDIENAKLK